MDKLGPMGIGVHWCVSFSPSDGDKNWACLLELMGPYLIEALKSTLMRLYGKQVQMGIVGIFKNHEGDANKAFLKPTGVK